MFLGIPTGSADYLVGFEQPATHEWFSEFVSVTAGAPTTVEFDLSRVAYPEGTGQVVGAVRSKDGRPCSTCTILIKPMERTYEAETDSQGNFRYLSLPAGEYTFTVQLPDGRSAKGNFAYAVGPGRQTQLKLDLSHPSGGGVRIAPGVAFNAMPFIPMLKTGSGRYSYILEGVRPGPGSQLEPSEPQFAAPGAQQEPTEAQTAAAAINQILNGPHKALPAPQAVGTTQGGQTVATITNRTSYLLSVYFSGSSPKTVMGLKGFGSMS